MIGHMCRHDNMRGSNGIDWSRSEWIWNAFAQTHQGGVDLSQNCNLRAVQLLLGHTKVDSTVRYLGVELENALSIAEKIDI